MTTDLFTEENFTDDGEYVGPQALFFTNSGTVLDMNPTPPRELGHVDDVDAARFAKTDLQVLWSVQNGQQGQQHAMTFLDRIDAERATDD